MTTTMRSNSSENVLFARAKVHMFMSKTNLFTEIIKNGPFKKPQDPYHQVECQDKRKSSFLTILLILQDQEMRLKSLVSSSINSIMEPTSSMVSQFSQLLLKQTMLEDSVTKILSKLLMRTKPLSRNSPKKQIFNKNSLILLPQVFMDINSSREALLSLCLVVFQKISEESIELEVTSTCSC
jgi:hypothetical protein